MIIGIGCDIVEHHLTKELKWQTDESLLKRIFTAEEIDLYFTKKNIEFLAGRFAVKEAVLKCLGTGMQDDISLINIQTVRKMTGEPYIELNGKLKEMSD